MLKREDIIRKEVTVIICMQNKYYNLQKVISKVLNQTYINFKVLVIKPKNIEIESYKYEKIDARISFYEPDNELKLFDIYSYILENIKSEYIYILNTDKIKNINILGAIKQSESYVLDVCEIKGCYNKYQITFKNENLELFKDKILSWEQLSDASNILETNQKKNILEAIKRELRNIRSNF